MNWYVYCSNNPVMFVDPSGLAGYHWIRDYGSVTWDENSSTASLTIANETHKYKVESRGTTFIQNDKMYVYDQELYNDFTSDRASAIVYAMDRAYYINQAYPYYSSNCTNFVSQCLLEGGFNTDKKWNIDKGITWHGWDYDPTVAWGTANGLYDYLVDDKKFDVRYIANGKGVAEVIDNVQPGDVVFWNNFDYAEKGFMNHAGFISKIENGDIYFCGNTNPRRNYSLSESLKNYNGDIYIVNIVYPDEQ